MSRSSIICATLSDVRTKLKGREVSFDDERLPRTPGRFVENKATRHGGATTVVTSVIRMPMPNTSCDRIGLLSTTVETPMPATIKATSPRGIIPAPTRSAPSVLNPQNSEGIAHPTTFAATARTVYIAPDISTGFEQSAEMSTIMPIAQKNTGTRKV